MEAEITSKLRESMVQRHDSLDTQIEDAQKKIKELQERQHRLLSAEDKFEQLLDEHYILLLKKFGLEFNKIDLIQRGPEGNINYGISATAVSTGKFKFISFKGYTKNGDGKNRSQLLNKKQKLEESFTNDQFSCQVNEFSIEDKHTTYGSRSKSENRVMFDFYLK